MGGKKIKQQEVRGCEEETQALFYQVTSLHIPAGSYVLSLRLSQGPATGPSLCQIYPLHSFISSFFNIYSNSILLSTSVTPTYSLRVLQLNFRTFSPKCYVYYIKYLKTFMYHFVHNFLFLLWLVLSRADILVRIQAIMNPRLCSSFQHIQTNAD